MPKSERSKRSVLISYVLEIDSEEMSRRGKLGAAVTHSRYDGHTITAAARAARRKRPTDEPPAETPRAEEAAHDAA